MRPLAALVLMGLAGCTESVGPLPRLQIPQLEQARQSVEGGVGRRYEDYGACQKTATDVAALVSCMDVAGYEYIGRSAEEQATECWRLRDRQANRDGRLPEAWCFRRREASTTP